MTLTPTRLATLLTLAIALAPPVFAGTYTVPDTSLPQVTSIATGQIVNPNSIHITTTGLDAINLPTMIASHPEITGIGQTVVVIDTGIDYTHPALAPTYTTGYDFTTGLADPMDNWAGGGGHGTHVSGIIASADPLHPGVAPGAKLIGLKVFDSTTGLADDNNITAALQWVSDHRTQYNITAVNISLGDSTESTWSSIPANDPLDAGLKNLKSQGVFVAVASGNDSYIHGQSLPAASKNAVSVGATYASSEWSQYIISSPGGVDPYTYPDSSGVQQHASPLDYGPTKNDIAFFTNRYKTAADGSTSIMAPGIFINSTIPITLDTSDGTQDGYTDMAGTSMAAPYVTAASVLVREALEEAGLLDPDPAKQVDQILQILQQTGAPLYDNFYAFGGNNANAIELPINSGNLEIRPSTDEFFSLLDLNAAINSVLPIPEPASLTLLLLPTAALLLRRGKKSRAA